MVILLKIVIVSYSVFLNIFGKRGRSRKLRFFKVGRLFKNIGKFLIVVKNIFVGFGSIFFDVKFDLEDVDGVFFVFFELKVWL